MSEFNLDNTEKAINLYGKELIANLIFKLKSMNAYSSGKLVNSLSYKLVDTVEGISGQLEGEDYFNNIEFGRRPGKMPKLSDIERWCAIKGIPRTAAFQIAQHIGKFGIKPRPMLDEIIRKTSKEDEKVELGLEKDIENFIEKNIINKNK